MTTAPAERGWRQINAIAWSRSSLHLQTPLAPERRGALSLTDAKRKALRTAAVAIVIVSIVTQALLIAYYWWNFDPRVSCDRLPHWGEWIACLHGISHLYILTAEQAVGSWLIAGVAMLLGRFVPPYISAIVPGGIAVVFVWFLIDHWHETVTPYAHFGVPTVWHVTAFATVAAVIAVLLVAPVAGGWLLGLCARTSRRPLPSSG
jgi:hypothetical protein